MRQSDWLAGVMALLAGGLAAGAGACVFSFDTTNCDDYPAPGCPGVSTTGNGGQGGTGGSGGHGGTGGTGGQGGDGGPTIDCTGDPATVVDEVGNIRDECAVFVSNGGNDTTGDGTMAKPYATLGKAFGEATSAKKPKVFACAATGKTLTEAVQLNAKLEVYGGFDCSAATWTWQAAGRTQVDGPGDTVAWTLGALAGGSLVSGFAVKAGTPTAKSGNSSIAMAVADVAVTIKRCDLEAVDGADGEDGTPPTDPVTKGADAADAIAAQMNACQNAPGIIGGAGGKTTCGATATNGGDGGIGGGGGPTPLANGDGKPGTAGVPAATPPAGAGGVGQTDLTDNTKFCKDGTKGADGSLGSKGAAGTDYGTLSLSGISGGDGDNGGLGTPGQGGGGGGASKAGPTFCSGGFPGNGASGGGGGAGGCGGKGGNGGKAGGSSIAMVSLGNKLTIDGATVTLKAGKGGTGGKGANGQSGGGFGVGKVGGAASGFDPSRAGCTGGNGGTGGAGGPSGGGRGGHSIGIAYAKAPAKEVTFATPPAVGMAGGGGTIMGGNEGAPGEKGAACDFSKTSKPCG